MLTAMNILELSRLREQLPKLGSEDVDDVMRYAVAIQTAGIPGDASCEWYRLEHLVIEFAWRLAYCRYIENQIAINEMPVTFDTWRNHEKTRNA